MLITFEGIDGSGKSLQCQMLLSYLRQKKFHAELLREPGGTKIGEQVRDILLNKNNNIMSDMTEALLFMAARAQLVHEKIIPALQQNIIIICDRFIDSSIAYQACARGLGVSNIKKLNALATNDIVPDITFFLDFYLTPKKILERELDLKDRLESQAFAFHKKVYRAYKHLAQKNPERVISINAEQTPEAIHKKIIETLNLRIL